MVCPCVEVYRRRSFMSFFLLLQLYSPCLVCLTWMVCVMGCKWPYNCCFIDCCFQNLFSGFSRCQLMNKIVMRFLSFFCSLLIFPYELALGRQFTLCTTDMSLLRDLSANWLVWFFLITDLTSPLPCIMWASWPIGIQPSNRLLVARGCLPVHTPILGKLDCQLVSTRPWPEFNSSDFLSTSGDLQGKQKKKEGEERERERERERESLYLWVKYEFDYPHGPNL